MHPIRIGTCGWSYPDWSGPFYPKGLPAGDARWDTPLAWDSQADRATTHVDYLGNRSMEWANSVSSRFDLAQTTVREFRTELRQRRIDAESHGLLPDFAPRDGGWWLNLFGEGLRRDIKPFRVRLHPPKPLDSEGVARNSALLVENVSNFIVEFAGDYVTQDNDPASPTYGQVIKNEPDHPVTVTDFQVYGVGKNITRKTRWYGLPRDVNGDGVIRIRTENDPIQPVPDDVAPLKDFFRRNGAAKPMGAPGYLAPFERCVPDTGPGLQIGQAAQYTPGPEGNMVSPYVCMWVNDGRTAADSGPKPFLLPSMLRVLIKVEDPTGRLPDGRWWEYILKP